jgi:hypothetical protein
MPARVPRPADRDDRQQGNGRPDHEIASKPTGEVRPAPSADGPTRTHTPEHDNRQVPRPQAGPTDRPDRHVDTAGRDGREQAPRVTEQHNDPRPESRPTPASRNEGVSRDMRPQGSPAREEHPAPRAEQPTRSAEPPRSTPAPARSAEPQHAAPARENKPVPPAAERKIDRLNDNPRSDVRYPRPYGTVREASYTSVARPTTASRMESDYSRANDGRTSVSSHTSERSSEVWGTRSNATRSNVPTYSARTESARAYSQPSVQASRTYSHSSSGMSRGNSNSAPSHVSSHSQASRAAGHSYSHSSSNGSSHSGSTHSGRSR